MHAKGEDVKLMVMIDGAEVASFRSLESVEISWGLSTEEFNYVGASAVEIDETNGPATLTFRLNPKSPDFGRLMDLRRKRALPQESRQDVRFDITARVNYGDGGTDRWKFPDVKISDGGLSVQGRTARVAGNMTAVCASPARTA